MFADVAPRPRPRGFLKGSGVLKQVSSNGGCLLPLGADCVDGEAVSNDEDIEDDWATTQFCAEGSFCIVRENEKNRIGDQYGSGENRSEVSAIRMPSQQESYSKQR